MNLVLLGPPGAGKGTQAAQLAERYQVPKISTGEILREVARQGGERGELVRSLIDDGQMVPDEIIQELVWHRLEEPDTRLGFILDGFPRSTAQAEALDAFLGRAGTTDGQENRSLTAVIKLVVGEEELVRRLSGRWVCSECGDSYHERSRPPQVQGRCDRDGSELIQRADDRTAAIRERLRLYHLRTEPVLEFYRGQDLLHRVDGTLAMTEVSNEIDGILRKVATAKKATGRPA